MQRNLFKFSILVAPRACQTIREGAAKAIRRFAHIPPVHLEPPYELEIRALWNLTS